MSFTVRLHSLFNIGAEPKFVGSIDCEPTNSYYAFRKVLEDIFIVDWPFSFWDSINVL